jgi:hypothetical protein
MFFWGVSSHGRCRRLSGATVLDEPDRVNALISRCSALAPRERRPSISDMGRGLPE